MVGSHISQYLITDKLGEGGMGVVYLAEDTRLGRKVALKFLPRETTDSEQDRQRFEQEAQAAARLNHPNICTIHHFDEHEGRPFLVMEHVEGTTLREWLREGPLPTKKALDYGVQIVKALAKAHEAGIIHRDIKPGNIMINADGRVKVMDFGLAKLKGTDPITQTGSTVGTIAYMAPEQIQGREVNHQADIFAFGVVFFEMLTGVRPFRGEHEAALVYSIVNEEPATLRQYIPDASDDLVSLFDPLLAKEPEGRISDASAVVEMLRAVREAGNIAVPVALPASSTSSSSTESGEPDKEDSSTTISIRMPILGLGQISVGGRRLVMIGAASLAALLLVGWWFAGNDAATDELMVDANRVAVFPFDVRGSEELEYLGESMVELMSRSLDGAGPLTTTDPRAILSRIGQEASSSIVGPDEARQIAGTFGAGRFVMGTILRVGDEVRLSAAWYGADGRQIGNEEVRTAGEAEIQSGIDALARHVISDLVGREAGQRDYLAAQTTTSVEALKAYLEGQAASRRGDDETARTAFERAVEADSTFALAYYRLSVARSWTGQFLLAHTAGKKAAELSADLPTRDSRLIQAWLAFIEHRGEEAQQIYHQLADANPDDVEAWYMLGETIWHFRHALRHSGVEARGALERALELEPTSNEGIFHLIQIAGIQRDEELLDDLTSGLEHRNLPEGEEIQYRALREYVLGEVQDIRFEDQDPATIWPIANFLGAWGKFEEAEALLRPLTRPARADQTRSLAHSRIVELLLAQGKLEEASYEVEKIAPFDHGRYVWERVRVSNLPFLPQEKISREERADLILLSSSVDVEDVVGPELLEDPDITRLVNASLNYLRGLLYSAQGEVDTAIEVAGRLEEMEAPERHPHAWHNLARAVRAEASRHNDEIDEALQHFEDLKLGDDSWYGNVRINFVHAELLAETGRLEEALSLYESLEGLYVDELLFAGPAYLGRARVLRELDRPDEAAEFNERFLALWQDADPVFQPKVQEARERLEQLATVQ